MGLINKCTSYFLFDHDSYKIDLDSALHNPQTHFFLDTSFLYKLLFVKPSIRNLIIDWLKEKGDRVHIPYWAYMEYMKRGTSKQSLDDIGPWAKFKHANGLDSFKKELYLYLDESMLDNQFSCVNECLAEYTNAVNVIRKIEKLASDYSTAHSEIGANFYPSHVMGKPASLKQYTEDFIIRCEEHVPPGFDETKKENTCGDYIIWNEVLDFESDGEKISIFLTEDKKKDWVYAPEKIKINGHLQGNPQKNQKISNVPYVFPLMIAQPQLCLEYLQKKGTDDFYVLSMHSLMERLLSKDQNDGTNKYDEFRLMLLEEKNNVKSPSESSDLKSNGEPSGDSCVSDVGEIVASPTSDYVYSRKVIRDSEYIPDPNDSLDCCIAALKSQNWYQQSAGLNNFLQNISLFSRSDKNKLFLLGRNIYQAACGDERDSLAYLRNLQRNIAKLNDDNGENHVLNGMLFEVYFNCFGKFRNRLKAAYLHLLLPALDNCEKAQPFISKCLEPNKERLLYIPGGKKIVEFSVDGDLDEFDRIQIKSIKVNGHEILKEYEPFHDTESCQSYYILSASYEVDLDVIKRKLSSTFAIPEEYVKIIPLKGAEKWIMTRGYRIDSQCSFAINDPSL